MAELVGGAFLSSFLSVLFDRMASRPVLDFISGKKNNNERLMRELKMKLLTANQLVDDAEEKQMRNQTVRKWLDDLKDAVYIVGDLLDEINTEALRRKLEGDDRSGSSSGTSWFMRSTLNTSPSDEFDDKTLEPKIEKILHVLHVILNEKDVLGLKEGTVKDRSQETTRQTTSQVDEFDVFGREDDRETIVNLLRSNDASGHKIGVLPIVGMGGIGKTTLAQLVYKDLKDEFGVQAWVCVGEEFDILRIAQTIYGRITERPCEIRDLDLLSKILGEVLTDKKFFFVLDDVWNENYLLWNSFMNHFKQYGEHGSKIIVTTRLEHVASMIGTLPTHHLAVMSEDDSWLLFTKHAFVDAGVGGSQPYLEDVGRQIVKKCKGLPLAAKSLGGLLHSVLNPKEWEKVLNSDIWELPNDDILPALRLSYVYLPSHLKRCFVYSSIFPKDYQFQKSELVSLWMAEDLLLPREKEMVEEVGNDYFDILISRCFFQHSGSESWSSESLFTMHDLINDLAKLLSGDFCLRLEDHPSRNINVSKTRHFSYMKDGGHGFEKFEGLYDAKYLHTFLPLPLVCLFVDTSLLTKVPQELLPTLQYLRLLNLSDYAIDELPNSIGNLKHLRHLDLSRTEIEKLPDTVCTLYNLQTLLLSGCGRLVQLPTKLGRLINLRHLDISATKLPPSINDQMGKMPPDIIYQMRKNRKMPPDMGNLKTLQTLSHFVLDKDTGHSNLEELKKLQNLRKTITLSGLGDIVHDVDALAGHIMSEKKYLDKLVLRWQDDDIEDPERDEKLLNKLQPHTNLKELVIESFGGIRFPSWVGDSSFSNLFSIELKTSKHCCSLPPLGQLSSLRKLVFYGFSNVVEIGMEFYGHDGCGIKPFRSLEELTFQNMLEWQDWSYVGDMKEDGGFFPNLHSLTLENCPKLTVLPLDSLLKLQTLELSNLESFSGSFSHLETKCPKFPSLISLIIHKCPNFRRFPDGGIEAPELTHMRVFECEKLRSLPEQMHTLLPSLFFLGIRSCPELGIFPEEGLPSKLVLLGFDCSKKLYANRPQWGLARLTSLSMMEIDFKECGEEGDSFLQEGLLPTTLTYLKFSNLPTLTTLPGRELSRLTFLVELRISGCPELQFFPEEAPNSLKRLICEGCPKLLQLPGEWIPCPLSRREIALYDPFSLIMPNKNLPKKWIRDVDGSQSA